MKINFKATIVFQNIWKAVLCGLFKLIIEEGSSRSSKTWSNFQVLFLYLYQNPLTTCTVLRDTQKSCREIVEVDFIKWVSDPMGRKKELEDGKITVQEFDKLIREENLTKHFIRNKTNHTWTFIHNNSFIRFTGLDDEDDAMGMTQDVCWINEPYNFSHEVYKQLSQRTSKFILFDWNPKQKHWVAEEKKKSNTTVLYSTFEDNPFCPLESKIQIQSYQPIEQFSAVLDERININDCFMYDAEINNLNFNKKEIKELKRCLENERVESASLYHWLVFGRGLKSEKPNRIFKGWKIIEDAEFNILSYPSYYGLDFGISAPTALVEMKTNGDGIYFLKERLYKPLNEMKGTLSDELELLKIPKNIEIICDSGNELNKSEGQKLRNAGFNVIFAVKGQGSVVSAIETIQKSTIYYTKESYNLEDNYENYSWKIHQGIQLDIPEETREDAIDAAKYVIKWYSRTRYLS